MYKLSKRSLRKLEGVHPHLVSVVKRALQLSEVDFSVTEGLRSLDRQHQLFNEGHSKTLNSRHLTGHAVDLMAWVDGKGSWNWDYYHMIAKAMKEAAEEQEFTWYGVVTGRNFQMDHTSS